MARKRPINADLPPLREPSPAEPAAAPGPPRAEPAAGERPRSEPPATRRRRRRPVPAALKAIGGLVAVALVFLVAAVLGGGGTNDAGEETAPAPVATPAEPAEEEAPSTPAAEAAEELGFPSFATSNTVRVGGADAASVGAAVALAVFPSATPAQRPAAVALVDEGEWQAAVAASVLMAPPLGFPLLVSSAGELPEPTEQALEALAPAGTPAGGGAEAFAIGAAATPGTLKTARVEADGGVAALAAEIAATREELAGRPPAHLVLAPLARPELALPAAAWAARSGDPVLFSGPRELPAATARALRRHRDVPVYVLGPSSAISSAVVREAAAIAPGVRRVSGEDAVANAIALARYERGGFGWNVNDPGHGFVVARADAATVAAVASPLSASGTWGPLLLTDDAARLPAALRDYLLDVKPGYTTDPTRAFYNHVWVIGDQEAIDVNQQAEIDQLAELARIGGGQP